MHLENDLLSIDFIHEGAQISSVKNKLYDLQYIHDGKSGWSQQNPLLFPMISNTVNKEQIIDGKIYHMANHGLVRRAHFVLESFDETKIVMSFSSNEETKQLYPFDFKLWVTYLLNNDCLDIRYKVDNLSDQSMPFQFGLHPAFKIPLNANQHYNDYFVEFEKEEHQQSLIGTVNIDSNKLNLNHALFEQSATILLKNVNSRWVKVSDGTHGIKVDIDGFNHLAFWTPDHANLLCIEPWCGHGDLGKEIPGEFKDRDATIVLEKNASWTIQVRYCFF